MAADTMVRNMVQQRATSDKGRTTTCEGDTQQIGVIIWDSHQIDITSNLHSSIGAATGGHISKRRSNEDITSNLKYIKWRPTWGSNFHN
ncbi:hypothetical protein J6590_003714 [Homalodisca vitripennis]|nr:hypothetical protein J6590_003714 [Homalodisca vitripennis]